MFNKKVYMKKYNKEHSQEQRQWRLEHRERQKENCRRYNQKHRDRPNGVLTSDRRRTYKQAEKIPLFELCELCPEDDKQKATERHHPDYDFPEIFISCCKSCHMFLEKGCA